MDTLYNPGIEEFFGKGTGLAVLISTACLIFIAAMEEFVRTLCKTKRHGKEFPKLINFNIAAFDCKEGHDQMEISLIKRDVEKINRNISELKMLVSNIDKKRSNTN